MIGVDKQQVGGEVIYCIVYILWIVVQLWVQWMKMFEKMGFVVVVVGDQIQWIVQVVEDLVGYLIFFWVVVVDDIFVYYYCVWVFVQCVKLGDYVGVGGIDVDKVVQFFVVVVEMGIGNVC